MLRGERYLFHILTTLDERGMPLDLALLPIVESLWMQAGPYVRAAARLHSPEIDLSATLYHRGILSAIESRDPDRVSSELRADINQAFAILERAGPEFWERQNRDAA